ncbi:MAG: sodium:glutamate symporter [Treponema sp.]|jgi:ESS family glutamate:Na+ symporter|nr:sodium:glutamate symporter [Treponema sp.]
MDFSSANTSLWDTMIQAGMIAGILLGANVLRRKVALVRKTLMPTSVLGGFLLLFIRMSGLVTVNVELLEMATYHGIAIGFIALSLRTLKKGAAAGSLAGPKSGALIVSCYVLQGILGLAITLALSATVMPGFFAAAGILLPMGYGQGPGQANNIGASYEALGFTGGHSFALSLAAAGFLSACIVGVIYLNILQRRGRIVRHDSADLSGSVITETFQDEKEIPLSESVDKLSIQVALILLVYILSFLLIRGLSFGVGLLGPGIEKTVSSLLWGFNFIFGSIVAMLLRLVFSNLRRFKIMTHQYQNNYLLSRISGLAFDIMIIAGIATIEISDLRGLWAPFLLLALTGAMATLLYLLWICRRVYPGYYQEGLVSMYGMMTGTISCGILLLREIDPNYLTPAANNLVSGSAFAVLFGFPLLALIGLAPNSGLMTVMVLGLLVIYLALLLLFLFKTQRSRRKEESKN